MRNLKKRTSTVYTNGVILESDWDNLALMNSKKNCVSIVTLRAGCGAVYYNRLCLCVCVCVGGWVGVCVCVCLCVGGSVTTITRNCVHRSSPNWIYR